METRLPADDGGWRPPAGAADQDAVEQRLVAIEARLAAMESSLNDAVAQGLQGAGEEMRRAVSDLGRLLLRDLDRLTKVLAEHRDTIVERLQPEDPANDEGAMPDDGAVAAEGEPVSETPPPAGEGGREKRRRRRRSG